MSVLLALACKADSYLARAFCRASSSLRARFFSKRLANHSLKKTYAVLFINKKRLAITMIKMMVTKNLPYLIFSSPESKRMSENARHQTLVRSSPVSFMISIFKSSGSRYGL